MIGLGPDHKMRELHFLLDRPLGLDALRDFALAPSALLEPLRLGGGGAGNADDAVEVFLGVGFKKQGNHHDGARNALRLPFPQLTAPNLADAWMKNLLDQFSRVGIAENPPRQFVPAQTAISRDDVRSKGGLNLGEGGFSWFNQFASDNISVKRWDAPL